jgi:hypothetical protein
MNDAYNLVREKRPIIAPNLVFMSQLMDYETKLNDSTVKANSNNGTSSRMNACSKSSSSASLNGLLCHSEVVMETEQSNNNNSSANTYRHGSSNSSSNSNHPVIVN